MKIQSILSSKGDFVATIRSDASVTELLDLLAQHQIGAVPVVDDEGIIGMVSERDIVRTLRDRGPSILDHQVHELMTTTVSVCEPSATVDELMSIMTQRRIRHIPVVEGDTELIGIVSIGDVVKARLAELETERDALQAYISS